MHPLSAHYTTYYTTYYNKRRRYIVPPLGPPNERNSKRQRERERKKKNTFLLLIILFFFPSFGYTYRQGAELSFSSSLLLRVFLHISEVVVVLLIVLGSLLFCLNNSVELSTPFSSRHGHFYFSHCEFCWNHSSYLHLNGAITCVWVNLVIFSCFLSFFFSLGKQLLLLFSRAIATNTFTILCLPCRVYKWYMVVDPGG
ncbi:hypothetical protein F4809DRAFT_540735 [Biscogniauxia mediterranea]|nr:hypothetical protein F4809DRAFT_540735 [Biscogniauxia mediterranea]